MRKGNLAESYPLSHSHDFMSCPHWRCASVSPTGREEASKSEVAIAPYLDVLESGADDSSLLVGETQRSTSKRD